MGKAQAAVELLVLISMMMIVLFLIFDFGENKIIESTSILQVSQARNTVDTLAKAVAEVHNEGLGSRRVVYITIPDRVNPNRIIIGNTTITIGVYITNGTSDVSAPTDFPVVRGGFFPTTPGSYRVWVISRQGYAQVGATLEVSPLSEYFELFPSNSTSTNISITNNDASPLNVILNLVWTDSEISATVNGTSSLTFNLPATSSNAQAVSLSVGANLNASQGLHSGYLNVATNVSESEIIPIVVNVVSPPLTSGGVSYLAIDTYNDSAYANPSTSFLAAGPTNVTYYKVRSYNSTDGLVSSNVTVRLYNAASAIVSEQTYPANNGTGVYIGNYSIPYTLTVWLNGWSYRKAHNITNATGADVNYTVNITVINGAGTDSGNTVYINNKARSDFGDIRFTDSTGNLLNYWTESMNNNVNATFWVLISGNLTSTNQTIYMYYGNSGVTTTNNNLGLDLFQLREHDMYASYNPDFTFGKSASSVLQINSTGGSVGDGYAFIIANKTFLNGKNISISARVYETSGLDHNILQVYVVDHAHLRTRTTGEFTDNDNTEHPIADYTNVITNSIYASDNNWYTNTSTTLNLNSFTSDYITILITLHDGWTGEALRGEIDWLKILDSAGNTLYNYDFGNSVVMEQTGTLRDYGLYRKYVSPEPSHGAWGSEESVAAGTIGTWKITAYDFGGATAVMYFTVLPNWLTGWLYRKSHLITNSTGADVNYTVQLVVINGSGTDSGNAVYINNKMRSDFGDIRFTDSTGNLLNYWTESMNNNVNATFWVLISGNLTSTNQTIYMYYGNPSVTNTSNGKNTFLFFDDFLTWNSTEWGTQPSWANIMTGGILNMSSTSTYNLFGTTTNGLNTEWESSWMCASANYNCEGGYAADWLTNGNRLGLASGYSGAFDQNYLGGSGSSVRSGFGSKDTNWHIWTIRRLSSGTTFIQDSTSDINPNNIPTVALPTYFRISNTEMHIDWVFVRKFISTEPAHGAWGSEESSS
jgi:hypothetical protein